MLHQLVLAQVNLAYHFGWPQCGGNPDPGTGPEPEPDPNPAPDDPYAYLFKLNSTYAAKYPGFAAMVKNIYETSLKNEKLMNCLKGASHMTNQQIVDALKWKSGPNIEIKDINSNFGGYHRYGYVSAAENPNVIYMEASDVTKF